MTWAEIHQYLVIPVLIALSAVIAGWAVRVGNAAVTALERKTGVQIAQQQHDAVRESALTGAGVVKTMLDQGAIKLGRVTSDNPVIVAQASAAIARVPDAAAAMDKTIPSMAETIVGLVDTSPRVPVLVMSPDPMQQAAAQVAAQVAAQSQMNATMADFNKGPTP